MTLPIEENEISAGESLYEIYKRLFIKHRNLLSLIIRWNHALDDKYNQALELLQELRQIIDETTEEVNRQKIADMLDGVNNSDR